MPESQIAPLPVPRICLEYGLTRETMQRRLHLLELGPADLPALTVLHEQIIAPHVDAIVKKFYALLDREPEYQAITGRHPEKLARLKVSMRDYLLTFGQEISNPVYFERRLRGGIAHEKIGLPLNLYQAAFRFLMQCIADYIPGVDRDMVPVLHAALGKVATLDMSIILEAYYQASVQDLRLEGKELRQRVDTDSLTLVASHDRVMRFLQQTMEAARNSGEPLCIVMADLDHFKRVNDEHGHLVGDRVLRDVAGRMKSAVRDFDLVGRYGGEEFLIVLRRSSMEEAEEVAERIRLRLAESPIHVDHLEIPMTISQGISAFQPDDAAETLIDRADRALYEAKEAGRNCVRTGV